ncbi:Tetratricopeptide repeat-containing protein [Candidatus Electrothrix laxa]
MRTYNLLRALLFFGLITLTLYQLRVAVIAQTSYSNIVTSKTIRELQSEPRLLVKYGKEKILEGNHDNAKKYLQKALRVNPVYIPAWLTLAELENNSGNTARSLEILEYLDHLMQDVIRWRWKKAMLAFLLEREDILKADLSWLLQQKNLSEQTRKKVLDFAFSLWPEPAELLKKMGGKNCVSLFLHALRIKNRERAEFLWAATDHTQIASEEVLRYINLLINDQKINEAALLWKEYYPADNLLYNGNFSIPPVKGGFGWRIWQTEGFEIEMQNQSDQKTALHLRFNGETNIHFRHVKQFVPLSAGQHVTLTGELRSKGMTTDQRTFLEIVGRDCSLQSATEMVEPNQDWTPFSQNFTLPDDCHQGVEIRIRRLPSKKIDSLISGELWVTNLSLQNAPPPTLQ